MGVQLLPRQILSIFPSRLTSTVATPFVEMKLDRTKCVLAAEMGTTSETPLSNAGKISRPKFAAVQGDTITLTKPDGLRKLLQRNLGEL